MRAKKTAVEQWYASNIQGFLFEKEKKGGRWRATSAVVFLLREREEGKEDMRFAMLRHLFEPFLVLAVLVQLGQGETTVIDRHMIS